MYKEAYWLGNDERIYGENEEYKIYRSCAMRLVATANEVAMISKIKTFY